MTVAPRIFRWTLAAAIALVPAAAHAADSASAQMMSQVATIPCAQADTAMTQMISAATAPDTLKMSGSADRDYLHTMQVLSGTALAMSKLEARCGTNTATRRKADASTKSLTPFFDGFATEGR